MSILKTGLVALLLVAASFGSYTYGRKTAPHLNVWDVNSNKFVPLQLDGNVNVIVAAPGGIEPGVDAKRVDASGEKFILILPPSFGVKDKPDSEEPSAPAAPTSAPAQKEPLLRA